MPGYRAMPAQRIEMVDIWHLLCYHGTVDRLLCMAFATSLCRADNTL